MSNESIQSCFKENLIKIENIDSKCGDIYITKNGFIFYCTFCNESFTNLQYFTSHIFNIHPFLSNQQNLFSHNQIDCPDNFPSITKLSILCDVAENINNDLLIDDNKDEKQSITDQPSDDEVILENFDNIKSNVDLDAHKTIDKKYNKSIIDKFQISQTNKKIHNSNVKLKKIKQINQMKIGYWQCDVCQYICKKGKHRKEHERTHRGVKRFICETCGKSYTKKTRLDDHIRTHTGEKPFKCRFCPKTFTSHTSMRSHDKTHIGFKPFKCNYCAKVFKTKNNKQTHEKKHHLAQPCSDKAKTFECTLCTKKFQKDSDLIAHIQRHTNKSKDKPFECTNCPSTFVNKIYLNAHERLYHRGEFNYKCDYCDKVFLKLNKKKQHEEMHTRIENEYACDLCEKKYARREGLAKHRKLHHNTNSQYKCDICDETFTSQSCYLEHCKNHNIIDKKFGCEYCEARFETEIRLERHLKMMHSKII